MPSDAETLQSTIPGRPRVDRLGEGKVFIIAGRCGRLANRMVLFANFAAFAEEHGYRLVNPTFHSYADLFETTRRDIYCRYPVADRRSLLDLVPGVAPLIRKLRLFPNAAKLAGKLNERLPVFGRRTRTVREGWVTHTSLEDPEVQARFEGANRIFVFGWAYRAPACMRRHAGKIRAYFKPIDKHNQAAGRVVENLRRRADVVVGVHVRHGDYRVWRKGRYFFPVERYVLWMREMERQFPGRKVSFLICSDEARNPQEFDGMDVGFGTGVPVEDMAALAGCDYIFGPVSSFTQWASFYGNKPLWHVRDLNEGIDPQRFCVSFLEEIPQ